MHVNPVEARVLDLTNLLLVMNGHPGWKVNFNNAAHRAGACRYGSKTIVYSRRLIRARPWEETRDTVFHEVAHVIAGSTAGHGPEWARVAKRLGGSGRATFDSSKIDKAKMDYKYKAVCPAGHTLYRARMPQTFRSCRDCSPGMFSYEHLFQFFNARTGEPIPYARGRRALPA